MGIFDKMMDAMNIDNDDDEFIDDDMYGFEEEDEAPRSGLFARRRQAEEEPEEEPVPQRPAARPAKVTPMRSRRQAPARSASNMEVCVIKPTQFDDSREVIETLLTGRPVILNMEGLDLSLAQRIIDVTSGACLAINGALQKISNYIFILTPASVDISGDLQGIIDAFDLSGLQAGF